MGILSVLPPDVMGLIVEFTVRNGGDRTLLNNTCKFFKSLCPPNEIPLRVPAYRFIYTEDLLIWAFENGASYNFVVYNALLRGYIGAIQRCMGKDDGGWVTRAIQVGQIPMADWLISRGFRWEPELILRSEAWNGRETTIKWLLDKGIEAGNEVAYGAANQGYLEIVKLLRNRGCPWDTQICERAAEGGHLDLLKWLRKEGCPWDHRTFKAAARHGHSEVVDFYLSETR